MGDMTIEGGTYCASNEDWEVEVVGSKGDKYLVRWEKIYGDTEYGWACTCPGHEWHPEKPCKHIKQVSAGDQRCAWNWEMEPGSNEEACPKCGGPVKTFRIAV